MGWLKSNCICSILRSCTIESKYYIRFFIYQIELTFPAPLAPDGDLGLEPDVGVFLADPFPIVIVSGF